jgi:hypothetical protein
MIGRQMPKTIMREPLLLDFSPLRATLDGSRTPEGDRLERRFKSPRRVAATANAATTTGRLVSDRPTKTLLPCADHCNAGQFKRRLEAERAIERREKLDVGADVVYPLADQFYCERDRRLQIPTYSKGFLRTAKDPSMLLTGVTRRNAEARDHLRAAADNEERGRGARGHLTPCSMNPGEHDAADERHHARDQREVHKRLAGKTQRARRAARAPQSAIHSSEPQRVCVRSGIAARYQLTDQQQPSHRVETDQREARTSLLGRPASLANRLRLGRRRQSQTMPSTVDRDRDSRPASPRTTRRQGGLTSASHGAGLRR